MKSDYLLTQEMINYLLNASDPVAKKELASYLEVSARTIKRLKDSINIEEKIISDYHGKNGGFFIEDKTKYKPPILLEKDRQNFRELRSIIIKDQSFINRNEYVKSIDKVTINDDTLEDYILFIENGFKLKMPIELLKLYYNQLGQAIRENRIVEISYLKPNSNNEEIYKLLPYELEKKNNKWYLNALKSNSKDQRQFKINRIKDIKILDEKFIKTKEFTHTQSTLKTYNLKLKIKNSSYIDELLIGENPKYTYLPNENTIILETELIGEYIVKGFILSLGSNCEVLEPIELRDEIKLEIINALKNY